MENSMEVPQKTKNRITIWSSNPTYGHISRQNSNSKRYMHPIFIAALCTIAKTWKQPKCPSTEEWIKKMWYIYTRECYSWNNAICSNMDGPRDCHTEWSKSDKRKRNTVWYCLYVESKKKMILMNLCTKGNRLTDFENELTDTRGKGGEG